jgi:hypothetical protein
MAYLTGEGSWRISQGGLNDELILSCCLTYVVPQTSGGVQGVVLFSADKVLGVKALVHQLRCSTPAEWARSCRGLSV